VNNERQKEIVLLPSWKLLKPRRPFLKWKLCPALGGRFGPAVQLIGHVAHSR
jgi:hypothetical protein